MSEKYRNFNELSSERREGLDYKIEIHDRGTDFVVLGIHGGEIEPGTEEVVRAIAGEGISSYVFLGSDRTQHITSANFDEPSCLALLAKCKEAISIHGKKGDGEFIMLGGLDSELVSKAEQALREHGFTIIPTTFEAKQESNICNRASSGKGLQMEMSRALRDSLTTDLEKMSMFVKIIRNLIQ
jgi:phage replication-related protein YjqB (UPF0714/DUF867 family)